MAANYGLFGTRGERNMANTDNAATPADLPAGLQARRLLRAARSGSLATLSASQDGGQPFATLVTPAIAGDGAILLLLSDLSEHTRHLRAEPRCSLLVVGAAESANPQTAPRLTVTGLADGIRYAGGPGALPGGASLRRALCRFRRFPPLAHRAARRPAGRRLRPRHKAARVGPDPRPRGSRRHRSGRGRPFCRTATTTTPTPWPPSARPHRGGKGRGAW